MLEVKFRGKRVDGGGCIEGDLVQWKSRNLFAILPQDGDKWSNPFDFTVHHESVGMYTGLKDKHGKEIFGAIGERGGDVVISSGVGNALWVVCFGEYTYHNGELEYEEGCGFYFKRVSDGLKVTFGKPDDGVFYEIIGNQYDNHELLG